MVFDRPIAQNQGIQFPIARAYTNIRAADLMRWEACTPVRRRPRLWRRSSTSPSSLAADASWEGANVCLQTHGGYGFVGEYDVERKFRETRLYQVAPISTKSDSFLRGRACARYALALSNARCLLKRSFRSPASASSRWSRRFPRRSAHGNAPTLAPTSSRVERPDGGDFARDYDSDMKGALSGHFAWLNRGKRSIVLDLKQDAGRTAFGRLIDRADVFLHNLAPGAVERLRLLLRCLPRA